MLYYTQLIYVIDGREEMFQAFEDQVLPLLKQHNGELVYRVRPSAKSIIETTVGRPYEVHIVTFTSKADFERYRDDPERLKYIALKNDSILKAVLIEGRAV